MRSLSNFTGYSYKQSQTCDDVQLCEQSGNINAEEHRTICVSEIDSNTNFKLIGKQAMWNGERSKALTRDNLGGHKGMRPVEVSMNQRLLYDLIRAKRGRAVIMSNDAWGCYNRIAHIAILLALRRLGIPRPPILAMLETIQKMQHYIRTAFGESTQSYGGDPSKPATQGILQGNGAGPAGWFAICSIMIDCMKAEGYGYADVSAISQHAMNLVCLAFVDDTDLVHSTFDPCLTSAKLFDEAQAALLTWESLLSATGGALKPSKS